MKVKDKVEIQDCIYFYHDLCEGNTGVIVEVCTNSIDTFYEVKSDPSGETGLYSLNELKII